MSADDIRRADKLRTVELRYYEMCLAEDRTAEARARFHDALLSARDAGVRQWAIAGRLGVTVARVSGMLRQASRTT